MRSAPTASLLAAAVVLAGCSAGPPSPDEGERGAHWPVSCGHAEPSAWRQDCLVRASWSPATKAELWVAINPTDPTNVVLGAKDMNPDLSRDCTWNRLSVTKDAGASWTELSIGGAYADRAPGDPYQPWACNTDPMFAFTPDGTLHYIMELYALGPGPSEFAQQSPANLAVAGVAFYLVQSHDGGLTWDPPRQVLAAPGGPSAPDHPWLVANPRTQTLHVALIDYLAGQRCHVLNLRGDDAPELRVLATPGFRGCSQAAVLDDGTLIVAGHEEMPGSSDGSTPGATWFASSLDDGRTFTDPVPGFPYTPLPPRFAGSDHEAYPAFRILGDPVRPRTLYATYDTFELGDADVLFRVSQDAGVTWSEPTDVGQDPDEHHQFLPALAASPDGALHAIYFDKRYDAANTLIDVTRGLSLDGGATWTAERLTTESWSGDLARHQYGQAWIGDYNGIAALGDEVWAAFPDAHLGTAPSMAAAHWTSAGPSPAVPTAAS